MGTAPESRVHLTPSQHLHVLPPGPHHLCLLPSFRAKVQWKVIISGWANYCRLICTPLVSGTAGVCDVSVLQRFAFTLIDGPALWWVGTLVSANAGQWETNNPPGVGLVSQIVLFLGTAIFSGPEEAVSSIFQPFSCISRQVCKPWTSQINTVPWNTVSEYQLLSAFKGARLKASQLQKIQKEQNWTEHFYPSWASVSSLFLAYLIILAESDLGAIPPALPPFPFALPSGRFLWTLF